MSETFVVRARPASFLGCGLVAAIFAALGLLVRHGDPTGRRVMATAVILSLLVGLGLWLHRIEVREDSLCFRALLRPSRCVAFLALERLSLERGPSMNGVSPLALTVQHRGASGSETLVIQVGAFSPKQLRRLVEACVARVTRIELDHQADMVRRGHWPSGG